MQEQHGNGFQRPAYLDNVPTLPAELAERLGDRWDPLTPQEEAQADRELRRVCRLVRQAREAEEIRRGETIEPEAPFGLT